MLTASTPVAPPDPRKLRGPHAESNLLERGPFKVIPRPEIAAPLWTRSAQHADLGGLLIAFRVLLTHESQFVSRHHEVPPSPASARPRTVDLVLPDVRLDEAGLPLTPAPSAPNWADVCHDLAVGTWFAHVQHVAELLEVGLRELDRGRVSTASALVRTAVEVAARLNVGLDELGASTSSASFAEHLMWLIAGEGSPDHLPSPGSITSRVARLADTAATLVGNDPAAAHVRLDNLYGRLCDLSHPGPLNMAPYVRESSNATTYRAPSSMTVAGLESVPAVHDMLDGVAAACAGTLACWPRMRTVVEYLAERRTYPSEAQTLAHYYRVDLIASQPTVAPGRTLIGSVHRTLWSSPATEEHLDVLSPAMAEQDLTQYLHQGTWEDCGTDPGGTPGLQGWWSLRVVVATEALSSITESLNRGECAAAAASARFLLEHLVGIRAAIKIDDCLDRTVALREGTTKRPTRQLLRELLLQTGLDSAWSANGLDNPSLQDGIGALNGLVHASLISRSLYWAQYGDETDGALRIPGSPKFRASGESRANLVDPWVLACSALAFGDIVLAEQVGAILAEGPPGAAG